MFPSITRKIRPLFLLACLLVPVHVLAALVSLDDEDLADVDGTGLALAMDDFEFAMAPTSYFEQYGTAPSAGLRCTSTGQTAGNYNCWRRGDLRWFGINISNAGGTSDGYHWNDTTVCSSSSLDCPRGGVIDWFAPFDNPYMLRAWSPPGMTYQGNCVNAAAGTVGACTGSNVKAIYEYLAPTDQPYYTMSWWGEIESGATRNTANDALSIGAGNRLKSQNIIRGNAEGSIFRLFQFTQTGNLTFAIFYHSYLQGDYRLSVAQAAPTNDVVGTPAVFAGTEGLYFRNVKAFIPLGQLYYQALTLRQVGTSGRFEMAMLPLPNTAVVYNHHYALNGGDTAGFETARMNNTGGAISNANYFQTHGYSRWGGWTAAGAWVGRNGAATVDGSTTGDGIYFRACSGCSNFRAYAERPTRIDKRGSHFSMHLVQNYNCSVTALPSDVSTCNPGPGPITSGDETGTLASGCTAYGTTNHNCYTTTGGAGGTPTPAGNPNRTFNTQAVNLGDARFEGLMFHSFRIESCGGTVSC